MHTSGTETRSARFLAATAAGSFAVVVAGTLISTPVLPLYRDTLGLSVFDVAAVFSIYLIVLVAFFVLLMRSQLTRFAWLLLPVAVLLQIASSAAMWMGADDARWLFVGRAIGGAAVGIATGSSATLVVAAIGERGRTSVATGALAGSALGVLVATLATEVLPRPDHLVYQLHAGALVAVLAALVCALVGARNALRTQMHASRPRRRAPEPTPPPGLSMRQRAAAYGAGAAGWVVGGVAAGSTPSALRQQFGTDSVLTSMTVPLVLMCVAWCSSVTLRTLRFQLRTSYAMALLVGGSLAVVAGMETRQLWPIVVAASAWGLGHGAAYTNGLRVLTRSLSPVQQGRTASAYAAFAYSVTAVAVLTTGAVASQWGQVAAMSFAAAVLTGVCTIVLILGRRGSPRGVALLDDGRDADPDVALPVTGTCAQGH
ncbi:hypothetical protein B1790_32285 [Mycobacterium sp. AT1]|nr:hypothetical protein B1790_32285 [Mycobacterium sp. AT1]